jgi:hypothetical protein
MGSLSGWRPVILVLVLGVAAEREAAAYTDPGSGALLWQVIASAFVGLMFYGRKVLNWTRRRNNRED